mmetsp:Transcript_96171/g.272268  ORF Transcript_96171/g.272268 Transcript_96171/m.272268 type:complete len:370 (-) Transcript_96171:557-1666(-)
MRGRHGSQRRSVAFPGVIGAGHVGGRNGGEGPHGFETHGTAVDAVEHVGAGAAPASRLRECLARALRCPRLQSRIVAGRHGLPAWSRCRTREGPGARTRHSLACLRHAGRPARHAAGCRDLDCLPRELWDPLEPRGPEKEARDQRLPVALQGGGRHTGWRHRRVVGRGRLERRHQSELVLEHFAELRDGVRQENAGDVGLGGGLQHDLRELAADWRVEPVEAHDGADDVRGRHDQVAVRPPHRESARRSRGHRPGRRPLHLGPVRLQRLPPQPQPRALAERAGHGLHRLGRLPVRHAPLGRFPVRPRVRDRRERPLLQCQPPDWREQLPALAALLEARRQAHLAATVLSLYISSWGRESKGHGILYVRH